MEAKLLKFSDFLKTTDIQFIIPVYQRYYDWTETQCRQLFQDILTVGLNSSLPSHFIGSIVYIHAGVYSAGMKKLTIIDGQQRLTSLSLFLLALSRKIKETGDEKSSYKIIKNFLINEDIEEEKLKLRPVRKDDIALKQLIDNEQFNEEIKTSNLINNYNLFYQSINNDNIDKLRDGFDKLVFVEVSLERGKDDPQRIFESLNSTGLDLKPSDLIRNYVLMDLPADKQTKLYEKYWQPIEEYTKIQNSNDSRLSDFIRDYLSFKFREIPNKAKVFEEFKKRYPLKDNGLEAILADLKIYASYYQKLLYPQKEPDRAVAERLKQFNKLEVNVSYPFLLQVYNDYVEEKIDSLIFCQVLDLIQSLVWRRFICNLPTNALNKIFLNLYKEIDNRDYIKSLEINLLKRQGQQRFPKNEEVEAELKVRDFYNIASKNRRYFLEMLENYQNTEKVQIEDNENITIEHILPQNPSQDWIRKYGKETIEVWKNKYLDTIANLTLSGNNGELSNKSFIQKRDLPDKGYKASRLFLNKFLADIDEWNEETILERFKVLTERTLKIWYYPDVQIDSQDDTELNIMDIQDASNKVIDYAIFYNKKYENISYKKLLETVAGHLFELDSQRFFAPDLQGKIRISDNRDDFYNPVQLSATYYVDVHGSANSNIKKLQILLSVFEGWEDELTIKFK